MRTDLVSLKLDTASPQLQSLSQLKKLVGGDPSLITLMQHILPHISLRCLNIKNDVTLLFTSCFSSLAHSLTLMQLARTTDSSSDIDVVEAQLDEAVRHMIADVFSGATSLPEQVSSVRK